MTATVAYALRNLPMVIAATSLGFVMVRVDGSIINVALAQMGTDLGVEVAGLQWVVDAYTLAFASLLLSARVLGDRVGARRVFVAGFGIFTMALLGCALLTNLAAVISARAMQGIGAALMVPARSPCSITRAATTKRHGHGRLECGLQRAASA
jgi:DHA2 family methylenomycin A resistance protein-like MFS transporter